VSTKKDPKKKPKPVNIATVDAPVVSGGSKPPGHPAPVKLAPPAPFPGWVRMTAETPAGGRGQTITGLVGDGSPKVSGGGGGWQSIPRDGRVGLQWWAGRDAPAVTFPLVFADNDGVTDPAQPIRVEERVEILERMFGVRGADDAPPPPIRFNSAGLIPLDASNPDTAPWRWVVTACDEADGTIRDSIGRRIFVSYTITLTRLVDDQLLISEADKRSTLARNALSVDAGRYQRYIVRKGDTLVGIAKRQYDDYDRWRDIGKANNIKHSTQVLKPGRVLRLPLP
jgi:hypothetical protein